MMSQSQNQNPNRKLSRRRGIGTFTNCLLLGLLAGLFTGQFLPASTMTFATVLTITSLCASVVISKLSHHLKVQAEKKACDRAVWELERRMIRLIPKRHMKAHGMHSHSPHALEETEFDWLPVARRGRTSGIPR